MFTLALLILSSSFATPTTLAHQGRLLNASGDPITQHTDLTVSLYDINGQSVYSESFSQVPFDAGYFSLAIGAGDALDANQLDQAVSVAISVNGGAELTPVPLNAAPFALIARDVRGGTVKASELHVGGQLVINGSGEYQGSVDWSKLSNTPVDSDLLAGLNCSSDAPIPRFTSSGWACSALLASDLSGTIDPIHLKFGNGAGDIAPGDHAHTPGDAATLEGHNAAFFSPSTHTHSGLLATSGGTLTGALNGTVGNFSEGIILGANASCVSGALRWTSQLEVCDGTNWHVVFTPSGQSAQSPALSCADLHQKTPALPSGLYWIDPNAGSSADAFEAYCEMELDGGGWTVLVNNDNGDVEPTGCLPRIGSDPSMACGVVSETSDFSISAAGLQFSQLIWATHDRDFQLPTAYTLMSWNTPVLIPSDTAPWFLTADQTQQTLPAWSASPQITCTLNGYTAPQSIGNTLPQTGNYGTEVVTVLGSNASLSLGLMSFTEHAAWSSTQASMSGFDDFQDGRGCGDQWTPQSERGKSSFILVR